MIRCAAKYLDTNQNGMLERSELESVMQTVPWLLRGEFIFLLVVETHCYSLYCVGGFIL